MKQLSRNELKMITGGATVEVFCFDVTCRCSDFHPEWEEWNANYCDVQDLYRDLNSICGENIGYCF